VRFVKLHGDGGHPVFVNPEAVERVVPRDVRGGGSTVHVAGSPVWVVEAPEEVAKLLEECPSWREVKPTKMPSTGR